MDATIQARHGDPHTSHEQRSVTREMQAAAVVLNVMADGIERTDAEMYAAAVKDHEYAATPGRLRHGRLAAQRAGLIVATGATRPTPDGGMSRVWRKV